MIILNRSKQKSKQGRLGGALLMWLIGVPIPIIIAVFLLRGCI